METSPLVCKVRTDMCALGMTSADEEGVDSSLGEELALEEPPRARRRRPFNYVGPGGAFIFRRESFSSGACGGSVVSDDDSFDDEDEWYWGTPSWAG